jgi:indole-3-glycerol phosphate synthase
MTKGYLADVARRKRQEIAALRPRSAELEGMAADALPGRPWAAALRRPNRVALIAELKRRAPSAGSLRPEMDPGALARSYEEAGASALSVLTDADFDGDLADLRQAREAVSVPALRKDFVLDPVQVYESRVAGADAILLIVRMLTDDALVTLLGISEEVGLETLVEVHDEAELERALATTAPVIGVNNRDLTTLSTSLEVTRRLAPRVPSDRVLVAESGIDSGEQVKELGELGVDAALVGRALVSHTDPSELAAELSSQPKSSGHRPT